MGRRKKFCPTCGHGHCTQKHPEGDDECRFCHSIRVCAEEAPPMSEETITRLRAIFQGQADSDERNGCTCVRYRGDTKVTLHVGNLTCPLHATARYLT